MFPVNKLGANICFCQVCHKDRFFNILEEKVIFGYRNKNQFEAGAR